MYICINWFCITDNDAAIESEIQTVVKYSKDMFTSLNICLTVFNEQEEVGACLIVKIGISNKTTLRTAKIWSS